MITIMRSYHNPSPLGIDAICINQTNLDERSQQVSIMGKIYSRATLTYVWLGSGSEAIGHLIQELNQCFNEEGIEGLCQAVKGFTRLEYWSRVWVVQEFVLSKELKLL